MDNYARSISSSAETTAQRRKEVRFEVELLVNSVDKDPHELFLREVGGERRMALQPYYCEAWAIAWLLQGVNSPRPLTHSIFVRTVAALGAQIENVLIHDVVDGLLHARVRIVHLSGAVDIDARASDCVAIALASNAPILVAERLL